MSSSSIDWSQYEGQQNQKHPGEVHQKIDWGQYQPAAGPSSLSTPDSTVNFSGHDEDNSVLGGFGRRAFNTVKGVIASQFPTEEIAAVKEHPTAANFLRLGVSTLPGIAGSAHALGGQIEAEKEAAHQAATQFKGGQIARGVVTGASMLDPFATSSVVNINRLEDEGRNREAMGQGAFDIASLAAGSKPIRGAVATGLNKVGMTKFSPLGDIVSTPRGTTFAESSNPLELQAYARQHGIPVNAAQLTEHNFPRGLQNTGERAMVGGTAVRQQVKNAQAALRGHVENLMDQMSPQTRTAADAGHALKTDISAALEREKQVAQDNYNAIDAQAKTQNIAVDFRPLKQLADSMFHDSEFIRQNAKSMDPKRGSSLLRDISKLPDRGTFADAQKLRSHLLDEARHPDNVISEEAQGWVKRLTGQADAVMMDAAHQSPGLEAAFRQANTHWENLVNDFNSPRSPLYQALKEPLPEKVPQKFLQRGSTGGSPSTVDMLRRYGINLGPLKRELLGDLADQKFKLRDERHVGGYDDDFLRALYSPAELEHIQKSGALVRSVGLNTNPSGTAAAGSDIQSVTHPKAVMPKFAAAKLTTSPGFNEFLMRPKGAPRTGVGPFGRAAAGSDIAGSAEDERERALMQHGRDFIRELQRKKRFEMAGQ